MSAKSDDDARPGEPADAADAALSSVMDAYWEALERGDATSPEAWVSTHPDAPPYPAVLRALQALYEARMMVEEDSRVTVDYAGPPAATPPQAFLAPDTMLGSYRLIRCLGRGGMGEVYLAEHQLMGKQVAVKVVAGDCVHQAAAAARFLKEVRLLAKLDPHPHVAAAFDAGVFEGRLYLVMEYVPGVTLSKHAGGRCRRTGLSITCVRRPKDCSICTSMRSSTGTSSHPT
jgi:hypothetical protein